MSVASLLRKTNDLDLGKGILGISTICFGIACFLQGDFTSFWQPAPEWLPFRPVLAFASSSLLVLSGAGLFFARTLRIAAIVQTVLFSAYAAMWLSGLIAAPDKLGGYLGLAEQLGIAVAAATLWARSSPAMAARGALGPDVARIAYGCCSIVFGFAHVVGMRGTMKMIPDWMPGDAMFWALATGVGHLAVGVALIADRLAIPATRIGGLMYLCFAVLAWAPGAITHPQQWLRWAGVAISLVLMAALWLIGDYLWSERTDEGPVV
ncbi:MULTISPECIES: DoxX family membrane protein [unclassified Caulobacter]|uniref:DoxX family membrane protein n=1 Tax=unclassified Caulobacter TaxID=2648921 RepID=UPI0006FA4482|nr:MULTISPECIES: DoxX family membrane protein [unclassified Caulobacter]KQV55961.1 hypothetical protein ASC62_18770 [Caulobacter sp. Root342]KQV70865.1 hypothetical protein ASC70_04485 [Caulobacter sp. Root343]